MLYSVGWNEKDDGGVVALKTKGPASVENRPATASGDSDSTKVGTLDPDQGDWVWQYPAKAP